MNPKQEFLGGKTWKVSLPRFGVPVPSQTPALKRLMLPQGELAQFHNDGEGIHFMAWIELVPGRPRGNHYHKQKQEYVYVLAGETDLVVAELDGSARDVLRLKPGDLAFISPGVAHVLLPSSAGGAVEFSPRMFDPDDIYSWRF